MPDTMDRLEAALADRYAIRRELGRGGMATVYLAEDLKHHRQVALKVLNSELAAALGPERFLREIELSAGLTHPHILPLHDSGNACGFLYYVMPYVEGESLRNRLGREKQLPLDDALRISREVADALSYAHAHGVIHRDVKPENILLESGHAVVADFGIARAIHQAGGETLTATGIAVGTPAYMSPEQAGGDRDLDGRSDLYSLGCVLYEMLAGQPPFTGPTIESVVHQHLTAEPPSITVTRPAVPGPVAAVLQRALAKNPADRFNPVALFAQALAAASVPAAPAAGAAPALRHFSRRRIALLGFGAMAAVAAAVTLSRVAGFGSPTSAPAAHERTAIAVLPFQNLSADGPHAYFAGGLHDELLTQLARVATLRVISRTSVMEYATRATPLRVIADELGVGTIIEGSVQVVGGRLRVSVQLIDAETDAHLWGERYDRTLDDAFAIQSDLAQRVVTAVGGTLGAAEQRALAEAPTANAEAYRLFLQGREYWRRPGAMRGNLEAAGQLFQRALALDSSFAAAHVSLSAVHGLMYWLRYDADPARAARQEVEARTALRLAPDLPHAHLAMGLAHYWGRRDYEGAMEELRVAVKGLAGDAEVWGIISAVHRRLGNWEDALAAYARAAEFDPRDAQLAYDQGGLTYLLLHRYAEADAAFDRALALAPDFHAGRVMKGWVELVRTGSLDGVRVALAGLSSAAEPLGPELGTGLAMSAELALVDRNPGALIALITDPGAIVADLQLGPYAPGFLYLAWAQELAGDPAAARAAYDGARAILEAATRTLPDDWRMCAGLGLALAGLGWRDAALAQARRLRESVEYRHDALLRPHVAESLALILARAGDVAGALAELEPLLAGPSRISAHVLRADPRWDPIRGHPGFEELLGRYP